MSRSSIEAVGESPDYVSDPALIYFELLDLSDELLIVVDEDFRTILFSTSATKRALGHCAGDCTLCTYFANDEMAILKEAVHELSGDSTKVTKRVINLETKEFGKRPYSLKIKRSKRGPRSAFLIALSDRSEVANLEHLNQEQFMRLQRLGDTLPNGGIYQIIGHRKGGGARFTYVSAGMERILGISATEIIEDEKVLYNLIHPDDRERVGKLEDEARQNLAKYESEFRIKNRYGNDCWILCQSAPYLVGDDKLIWDGILVDITRLKNAERALLEAKSELERESQLKDDFLATLSHELRSPLHAILGWTQLIRTGRLQGPDLAKGMDVIERSTKAQSELIDDLLDVSRIVADTLRLEIGDAKLEDIVRLAVSTVESGATEKGVNVTYIGPESSHIVRGDSGRLRQVFVNLLTNAVKFTPSGGSVTVQVSYKPSIVEVAVTDSGIGISEEFLPYVFERFRQASASTTRKFGGLGLGLSIVKKIVALHSGTIEVKSDGPGRGAQFVVRLPHSSSEAEIGGDTQNFDGKDKRILQSLTNLSVLVVDDDFESREILRHLFESRGAKVSSASCAEDALSFIASEKLDLMVSDISMPDMDGYQLLSAIRSQSKARFPAIALTALARPEDKNRVLQAGFDLYLVKPLDHATFVQSVETLLNR